MPTSVVDLPPAVAQRAAILLYEHQRSIWQKTDRLLAGLLVVEWIAAIGIALAASPLEWFGAQSRIHPHLWAASVLGLCIISLPAYLAWVAAGSTITRHVVAVSQMLMSGLLIHLGDGRIEMHFHIFGSLAFLAFYRDWRVLVTATAVVAIDHLLRGMLLPQSIYGVAVSTGWQTLEHAGWVVFEDIFLIGSCFRSAREMRGIAQQRALLEQSYHDVEQKVQERTAELKSAQADLLNAARTAGMAEIATSVLHNVGNVLNSVNVSATVVAAKLRDSEVASLAKVSDMIVENKPHLMKFLAEDKRGQMIPDFITDLANCLGEEQNAMITEIESLTSGIDHIREIVAAQQSMAKRSKVRTEAKPATVFEQALTLQTGGLVNGLMIVRRFDEIETISLDEHKVLQILVNLISNARQAVANRPAGQARIGLNLNRVETAEGSRVAFTVSDNGVGIEAENFTRIFSHGFTTKAEGHGFGLHSAVNAAREMGGDLKVASDGLGMGAAFTLEIPVDGVDKESTCKM